MFEIGFSELVLIAVVALLVFGPDKLPGLARNVGLWTGRIRRMVNSVQQDVQRELSKVDELKRLVDEQKNILERHAIIDEASLNVPITGKPSTKKLEMVPPHATAEPASEVESPSEPTPEPGAPLQQSLSLSEPSAVAGNDKSK